MQRSKQQSYIWLKTKYLQATAWLRSRRFCVKEPEHDTAIRKTMIFVHYHWTQSRSKNACTILILLRSNQRLLNCGARRAALRPYWNILCADFLWFLRVFQPCRCCLSYSLTSDRLIIAAGNQQRSAGKAPTHKKYPQSKLGIRGHEESAPPKPRFLLAGLYA